jgi:hypothetical protein
MRPRSSSQALAPKMSVLIVSNEWHKVMIPWSRTNHKDCTPSIPQVNTSHPPPPAGGGGLFGLTGVVARAQQLQTVELKGASLSSLHLRDVCKTLDTPDLTNKNKIFYSTHTYFYSFRQVQLNGSGLSSC